MADESNSPMDYVAWAKEISARSRAITPADAISRLTEKLKRHVHRDGNDCCSCLLLKRRRERISNLHD